MYFMSPVPTTLSPRKAGTVYVLGIPPPFSNHATYVMRPPGAPNQGKL